jgi:hypothetical protein
MEISQGQEVSLFIVFNLTRKKTRNDLRIALAKEEARKQKRTDAVSKATELMLLLQTDEA